MTDGFREMEARMDQFEQHLADLESKFDSSCGAAILWKKAKNADKEESKIWDADFNGKLVKIKDLPLDVVSAMVDEKCGYMKDGWILRKISFNTSISI
uniref:START domain-containing protein n=1 Tax=Strongyloides venezuelensis TaxID=75913 RepID=A0A0K0FT71_STRVS